MLLHLVANTVVAFFPIGHAELPATMRSCYSFLYQGPGALFLRSKAFLALSWTSLNRTDAKCQQLGNLRAILSQEGMIMDEQIPRSWSFVGTILRCLQWSCCLPTAVPFFPPPWFTVSWLIITSWDHFPNRLSVSKSSSYSETTWTRMMVAKTHTDVFLSPKDSPGHPMKAGIFFSLE